MREETGKEGKVGKDKRKSNVRRKNRTEKISNVGSLRVGKGESINIDERFERMINKEQSLASTEVVRRPIYFDASRVDIAADYHIRKALRRDG